MIMTSSLRRKKILFDILSQVYMEKLVHKLLAIAIWKLGAISLQNTNHVPLFCSLNDKLA